MSIEHKNTSAAANLDPASPVIEVNADDSATNGNDTNVSGLLNVGEHSRINRTIH